VADVAGEQALALDRRPQLVHRLIEGAGQLAEFVVAVIGGERRRQWQQLVAVAHLAGQPDYRIDDPARGQPADQQASATARKVAGDDHPVQQLLARLEGVLVARQDEALAAISESRTYHAPFSPTTSW
jgi:hypothetical protein